MRRAKSSTSGIVSCSLVCKHGPDYICATMPVIHTKSIQGEIRWSGRGEGNADEVFLGAQKEPVIMRRTEHLFQESCCTAAIGAASLSLTCNGMMNGCPTGRRGPGKRG